MPVLFKAQGRSSWSLCTAKRRGFSSGRRPSRGLYAVVCVWKTSAAFAQSFLCKSVLSQPQHNVPIKPCCFPPSRLTLCPRCTLAHSLAVEWCQPKYQGEPCYLQPVGILVLVRTVMAKGLSRKTIEQAKRITGRKSTSPRVSYCPHPVEVPLMLCSLAASMEGEMPVQM